MKEDKYDREFVLQLFNLEDADVQDIRLRELNEITYIDIWLIPKYDPCPECGSLNPKIKDYSVKKIIHSVLSDRKCIIVFHRRRYKCRECNHTYSEANPFVFKQMSISAKTVIDILRDLKNYNETFSSLAARYHVSPTSVASIFDSHVRISRKPLPKRLNIDECYAFKHDNDKYICLLLDFDTHKPIDVLNTRNEKSLTDYFLSIPREERRRVEIVSFDMSKPFRRVMKNCFENSVGICDHFHVVQDQNRYITKIRIRVMKGFDKKTSEYRLLKKFNWMLFKDPDELNKDKQLLFDPNAERKYNRDIGRYANYYEIRESLLDTSPDLRTAYYLRLSLNEFYEKSTAETGETDLRNVIREFRSSNIPEMVIFGNTLATWKVEIVNSLAVYGYRYNVDKKSGQVTTSPIKISNAIIENRNAIVKCIKKNANGYTCWHRFRNRVLYVLDKDATYSLNPLPQIKKINEK